MPKRMAEGVLLVLLGVLILPLLPVILVWRWGAGVLKGMRRRHLCRRFERSWGRMGKQAVFVYSNSPHWKDRIEREILPLIEDRVVTLNWSDRNTEGWRRRPDEVRVFECWGGKSEFNPLAVVFRPGEPVRVIRFWQAYRDFKHGRPRRLREAETELLDALELQGGVRPEAYMEPRSSTNEG